MTTPEPTTTTTNVLTFGTRTTIYEYADGTARVRAMRPDVVPYEDREHSTVESLKRHLRQDHDVTEWLGEKSYDELVAMHAPVPFEVRFFEADVVIRSDGGVYDDDRHAYIERRHVRIGKITSLDPDSSSEDVRAYSEFCQYLALQLATVQERLDAEPARVHAIQYASIEAVERPS